MHIIPGPALYGFFGGVRVPHSGDDYHLRLGFGLPDPGQNLHPVAVWHVHIQKNQVQLGGVGQAEPLAQGVGANSRMIQAVHHLGQQIAKLGVVVYDKNASHEDSKSLYLSCRL